MNWGQHISNISSRATKTSGFLCRSMAFAPRSTKEDVYYTLVHPKQRYAAPIWSPYCKAQIQHMEKVRPRQPAGPTGGGATRVVLVRCSTRCNCQLWRPGGTSPLCFSFTRFIVGLCLLIKTRTWPRLRVQDLPGHHTTRSIACPRLVVKS